MVRVWIVSKRNEKSSRYCLLYCRIFIICLFARREPFSTFYSSCCFNWAYAWPMFPRNDAVYTFRAHSNACIFLHWQIYKLCEHIISFQFYSQINACENDATTSIYCTCTRIQHKNRKWFNKVSIGRYWICTVYARLYRYCVIAKWLKRPSYCHPRPLLAALQHTNHTAEMPDFENSKLFLHSAQKPLKTIQFIVAAGLCTRELTKSISKNKMFGIFAIIKFGLDFR